MHSAALHAVWAGSVPGLPTQWYSSPHAAITAGSFGIWRDREDMADVAAYLRKLRAPRYNRDGSRNEP